MAEFNEETLPDDLADALAENGYRWLQGEGHPYFEVYLGQERVFVGKEAQIRLWIETDEPAGGRRIALSL